MNKKVIVYCDDQQRFLDQFMERHRSYYDIIPVNDARDLLKTVEQLKKLPDLVLLDLYHPREDGADFKQKVAAAEESLSKLDQQILETKHAVENAWEPSGLEVLKLLRMKYTPNSLPVVMFSQKGLILLNDNQLREAEVNGAHWLLKKQLSARTEQVAIDRLIAGTPEKVNSHTIQIYRWVLALSWLFIGLLTARLFFSNNQFSDITIAAVIGIITALISYLLAPLLHKLDDKN